MLKPRRWLKTALRYFYPDLLCEAKTVYFEGVLFIFIHVACMGSRVMIYIFTHISSSFILTSLQCNFSSRTCPFYFRDMFDYINFLYYLYNWIIYTHGTFIQVAF